MTTASTAPIWDRPLDDATRAAMAAIVAHLAPLAPQMHKTGDLVEIALAIEDLLRRHLPPELDAQRQCAQAHLTDWLINYVQHTGAAQLKLDLAIGAQQQEKGA